MPRKKTKQKNLKRSNGIVKISNLAPKSFLSNAFSNYKKNKELNKIKAIKLEKLKEKNQILKERKDLNMTPSKSPHKQIKKKSFYLTFLFINLIKNHHFWKATNFRNLASESGPGLREPIFSNF